MNSIVGLDGLHQLLNDVYTKIAIANKETIICAWNLIKKELKNIILNLFQIQNIFLFVCFTK